jgi:hypothetical protein
MNPKIHQDAQMIRGMMNTLWIILGCEDNKGYYEAMECITECYDRLLKDLGISS